MEIKIHAIVEIAGFPEAHITETMKNVMEKLKEEKDIKIIKKSTAKTKKVKELWSTYAELELSFKNLERILGFCFDYMPSTIEILEPLNLNLNTMELTQSLNDLLAKLHNYSMFINNLNAENIVLKKKLNITSN